VIDEFQFDDRAAALYKNQRDMAKRDDVKIPFTREQFTLWLWRQLGGGTGPSADALKAFRCPYGCGRVLDILELTIDHMVPRGQSGSYDLANLIACCDHCNRLKGNMTATSFRILMAAGLEMAPLDWSNLQTRLLDAAKAQQLKWRNLKLEREKKSGKPLPVCHPPARLDFDNDPTF
jgi:hypothetical protein